MKDLILCLLAGHAFVTACFDKPLTIMPSQHVTALRYWPAKGKSRPISSLESLQAVSVSAKIFGARVSVERHASLQQHAMTQEMAQRVPDATDRMALKLEEFLPYRLNVCSSLVSHALSRIYADRYKIGVPEWRVLVTLGQFGAMTAKAIMKRKAM